MCEWVCECMSGWVNECTSHVMEKAAIDSMRLIDFSQIVPIYWPELLINDRMNYKIGHKTASNKSAK